MIHEQISPDAKRIAIFLPRFGQGGVERVLINLAREFRGRGYAVDVLLAGEQRHAFIGHEDDGVHYLRCSSNSLFRLLFFLIRYLKSNAPDVLISSKLKKGHALAVFCRKFAGVGTRIYLRVGTHIGSRNKDRFITKRIKDTLSLRYAVRGADGVIAVSSGIARDIEAITRVPGHRIQVVPNPTITSRIYELAAEPAGHLWVDEKRCLVILAVGSLRKQKDFPTLVKAFARFRQDREAKLIILGEGRQGAKLEELAIRLNVSKDIDLPGFSENPYAYMSRADLFVLSSAWEGSPNVLIEAMALGVPVVSTDCPSGPREILEEGRYGRLVPVGDSKNLADEMAAALEDTSLTRNFQEAVQKYDLQYSAGRYLDVLKLSGESSEVEQ